LKFHDVIEITRTSDLKCNIVHRYRGSKQNNDQKLTLNIYTRSHKWLGFINEIMELHVNHDDAEEINMLVFLLTSDPTLRNTCLKHNKNNNNYSHKQNAINAVWW